ncbi:hypothetical protein HDU78_007057 [Chytriomyces hyalinus]|nr:hypothetical protein HDU78_007057 [Chytriomyces hyalinus]
MALVTGLGLPSKALVRQPQLVAVISSTLSAFADKHASDQALVKPNGPFTMRDKKDSVDALVAALKITLERENDATEEDVELMNTWKSWPREVMVYALQSLKILGREIAGSDSLMSKHGISMLMMHAGLLPAPEDGVRASDVNVEAMKCLVNCLHINEACRDTFVEKDGIASTLRLIQVKDQTMDAIFLGARFLFLLSGHSAAYAAEMAKMDTLGALLVKVVTPFTNHLIEQKPVRNGLGNELSIADEILKVVFNITMVREEQAGGGFLGNVGKGKETEAEKMEKRQAEYAKKADGVKGFESFLPVLVDLITCIPVKESDPLSAPHSFAINCLLNFPANPDFFLKWLPGENKDKIPSQLCKVLSCALKLVLPFNQHAIQASEHPLEAVNDPPNDPRQPDYSKRRADETVPPVILVLKELANCHESIRKELRQVLTPEDIDRTKRLDTSNTTVARLIRLMSSISMENVKNSVGELLFALFDEDASKLTSYIGYGNAAGFLFHRGIMADPNAAPGAKESTSDEDGASYEIYDGPKESASASAAKGKGKAKAPINPITGEIMSDEQKTNEEWDRLSEAEKEYETHKLMEMLDKLNKSGFIKAVHKDDLAQQNESGSG